MVCSVLVHTVQVLFHCEVSHHSTSVKVQNTLSGEEGVERLVVSAGSLVRVQFRFSLSNGAIITRHWFKFILCLLIF